MRSALGTLILCFGLALAGTGPASAQNADPVLVRVGEHAEFHRMVIDWPEDVAYSVVERPGQVIVTFERSAALDLSRYRADPPPFIQSVQPIAEGGRLAVRVGIPNRSRVEYFKYRNKFVLDVYKPALAAAPAPRTVQPQPAPPQPDPPKAVELPKPAPEAPAQSQAKSQSAPVSAPEPEEVEPAPKPVAKAEPVAKKDYDTSGGESWLSGLSIGPTVSTLGLGGEIGYRFNDFVGIRLGANHLTRDFEDTISGNDFDFGLDLLSGGGVVDVYPFGRVFRITGGGRYNANNLEFVFRGTGDVDLGGSTFTQSEVGRLEGNIDFSRFAPYAGVGLEGAFLDGHLVVGFDVGILFQGDPNVDLSADGTRANDPVLIQALRDEEDEIDEGLKLVGVWDLSFYPVVGLSAAFRF